MVESERECGENERLCEVALVELLAVQLFCKDRGCKQKYHYRKKAGWAGYV